MDKIEKKIEERKESILEFAKALIRIPTQNPPKENYAKIVERIKQELASDNLIFEIHSKISSKPNLVAKWNVGSPKTIHLNSHYDVVPASQNWKHKPFEPVIEDGKLFGRGAQDMKSALACTVYAVKILKELNLKPVCNVELSFTCDEESGGEDGAGFLIKNKLIKPDFALIIDGSTPEITYAHKGILAMEITVMGKPSHAAYPQNGVNAFLGACKLSEQLNALNQEFAKVKSKHATLDPAAASPTLVLGGETKGGNKFNTVPGEFSFTIDRRLIPEESSEKAKSQILAVISRFEKENPQYKTRAKVLLEADSSQVDKNAKICKAFSESVKNVTGKTPPFFLLPGFLDMRYFVNDGKIDCINYGISGANLHGDDEFVYVDSIIETVKVLVNLLLNPELAKD